MQALTIMFSSRSVYFDRCWTRRMSNGTAHMNGPSSGKYIDTIGKWKLAQLSAATFDLPIHHHWFPDGDKECHGVPNLLSKHAWAVLRLLYRQNSFLSVEYWKKKGAIFTQNTVVLKVSLWKDKKAVSKLYMYHFITEYIMDQVISENIYLYSFLLKKGLIVFTACRFLTSNLDS